MTFSATAFTAFTAFTATATAFWAVAFWALTHTVSAARPHSGIGRIGPLNNDALALQDPTGCSGALISLQEACSRSVFVAMASSVASSIDCELQRTNNLVEIFAQIFQRADSADLKSVSEISVPHFNDTKLCQTQPKCWNCNGIRYAKYADRTILMLPQPTSTGKHYAYVADKPRGVRKDEKLETDEKEIEKGLRYASLGSGIDDFEESKNVFFTPHLHTRLQYFGNDPAIVVNLWSNGSGSAPGAPKPPTPTPPTPPRDFACNLRGPPPQNQVPVLLGDDLKRSRSRPVSWSRAAESRTTGDLTSQASAAAYKQEMDNAEIMGAVTMTVNMTYLGEALGRLPLSPNVYAMIADRDGRVTMMTPRGRETIFHKNMSESQIRNPENQRPCRADKVEDDDCWWNAPKPLTLLDAQKEEKFSQINFEEMLQHVFNDSLSENHSCSSGVRTWTLDVPRCGETCYGQHCGCQHLAVFCRLVGFPTWAMFVLAPLEELQGAATFTIDKENISVDYVEKKGDVYEDHIMVRNTGRVRLPFSATVSAGKGDTISGITVDPANGTLSPGENATLTLKFNLSSFGYGTSSGLVNVQADLSDDIGTCFNNRTGTRFLFTRRKYPTLLHVSGISVSVIATVVFFIILYRVVSSFLRRYYDDLAKEHATIEKALQATQELAFPMVLLKVESFKKHGRFMAFEETLNETLWLHTIQDIDDFLTKDIKEQLGKKNKVIFMSHQWTAFSEPDHTGEQYRGMVEAVDNVIIQQNRWIEEDTYVWLDYSSIPQRHRPSQTAAINSLTVYAAKVSAFIVVAPEVNHKDLEGVLCNEDSYKKRAWCRAEQLSHLLAQAGDNMYLAKQKEPGQSMPGFYRLNEDAAWLEQCIEVFKGELTCCRRKHDGMDMCDRERLVVPMLGLWAQLCRTVRSQAVQSEDMSEDDKRPFADLQEIHKHISDRIDEIFPATFTHEFEDGSEERTLFGKLVQRLEERLDKEVGQPKQEKKTSQWSKLRLASKIRLPSGGRRLSEALRSRSSDE